MKEVEESQDTRAVRIGIILDDFHSRRARGEDVSETELLEANPDLADDLRQSLEVINELNMARSGIDALIGNGTLKKSNETGYSAELGSYKTIELIGRGGMGIVLKAYEDKLDRLVALKILRPELSDNKTAVDRFKREARAAAALRHPNIVRVHTVGEERGVYYIAMEFIDGPNLSDFVRQHRPLPTDTIHQLMRAILSGLTAAHKVGLIHRDIKSSNILLDGSEQRLMIADFGLARMINSHSQLTLGESVLGTPAFMSPEQIRGDPDIDHRTDIYSAGVVLYEMLTRQLPFGASAPATEIHQVLNLTPNDPRALNPEADPQLADMALRMMAKRPADRFDSAAEVIRSLESGMQIPLIEQKRRNRRRTFIRIGVAGLIMAIVLGAWKAWSPSVITAARVDPDNSTTIQVRYGDDAEWTNNFYSFPSSIGQVNQKAVARFVLDDRGALGVLAGVDKPFQGKNLFAIDPAGELLWGINLASNLQWPDCKVSSSWTCKFVMPCQMAGEPSEAAITVTQALDEYQTRISIIDPRDGKILSSFWHFGQLSYLYIWPHYFGINRSAILALGVNNKLDGFADGLRIGEARYTRYDKVSVVMILDPNNMDGLGPPHTPRVPIGPVIPHAYAFLDCPTDTTPHIPKGQTQMVIPTDQEIASVIAVEPNSDGLRIITNAGAIITTDRNLTPEKVLIADTYPNKDKDFWRQRWRPYSQHGRRVLDSIEVDQ